MANSSNTSKNSILVVVFLRGGCDGLNMLAPSADPIYLAERRLETRVERDGDHPGLQLKNTFADSDFRFHFKAQKLKELYDAKHLALVHACGLTNGTRSHFEAMDYIERGTPDDLNTSSGWLARLIEDQKLQGKIPVVSTANSLPKSLLSAQQAIVVPSVKRVQLQGDPRFHLIQETLLKQQYQGNSAIALNGLRTLGIVDTFNASTAYDIHGKPVDYIPTAGVTYPTEGYSNELTNSFKTLAQLIKMDIGLRIATVDYGGWDTHVDQANTFPNLVDSLSRGLGAFWDDMAQYQDRITVVVMSEFGRRLKSNESRGTDHGHGNMMMVLGAGVKGGDIYGRWPGLANEALDNHVDLAVTTDYRTVLSEVMVNRFAAPRLNVIFPKYTDYKPIGIMNA